MDGKFQSLGLVVQNLIEGFHVASDGVLHGPDVLENVIRRNVFRIDHTADIQSVDDLRIRHTIYFGDGLQPFGLLLGKK